MDKKHVFDELMTKHGDVHEVMKAIPVNEGLFTIPHDAIAPDAYYTSFDVAQISMLFKHLHDSEK